MPTTPLSGAPYPSGSQAPAAAADLMALAMHYDAGGLLTATDAADRDSKYADAPVGTPVISVTSKAIWVKTDAATPTWWTIVEDTGWIEATLTSPWTPGETPQYRRLNGAVYLTGRATNGANDTVVLTLPVGFRPPQAFFVKSTQGGLDANARIAVHADGRVVASHLVSGQEGNSLSLHIPPFIPAGV